jgi:hypothetical protein
VAVVFPPGFDLGQAGKFPRKDSKPDGAPLDEQAAEVRYNPWTRRVEAVGNGEISDGKIELDQ